MWRIVLIVAVIVVATISLWPPAEKIHLGLDLRGGIHLVLRVNTADAEKAELDDASQRLIAQAKEKGVTLGAAQVEPDSLSFRVGVPIVVLTGIQGRDRRHRVGVHAPGQRGPQRP